MMSTWKKVDLLVVLTNFLHFLWQFLADGVVNFRGARKGAVGSTTHTS